jgi:YcxB-like protein
MPRIEYTLSFENYLEMTRFRHEKPRYTSAIVFALAGFSFMATGYIYLRIWPDTWPIIGGILLSLGFLAAFLAMPLAFLAKPKSSRQNTATLRGEYDRYHSDKRAIDFDVNGWRVLWYEGEDVRPWSRVKGIHNLKTLLVLSTETTHYWLPKAALEQDGHFAQIKALAETALRNRESLFTVPMRPSSLVYVEARLFHDWRLRFGANLLCYAVATLVVYWIAFSNSDNTSPYSLWPLAFVPVLLLSCHGLYHLRNYFFANWSEAAREAEIMSDCVGYKTDTVQWIAEYRSAKELREVPGAFLLYFAPHSFHLIPKRGFSSQQIVTFRNLLASHREDARGGAANVRGQL